MPSIADLEIADTLTYEEVNALFGGNPQSGIRTPVDRDLVAVINKHTDPFYEDKWIDGILHYTGQGRKGDQELTRANRRLADAAEAGQPVYLLEVFENGTYIFQGEVELCGDVYRERQLDDDNAERNVLMFPLKPKLAHIQEDDTILSPNKIKRQKKLFDLSLEDLYVRAREASESNKNRPKLQPQKIAYARREYTRDDAIAALVKRLAHGNCHLCGNPAPFIGRNGQPFLESHHILWLSRGGDDILRNCIAICPNCHRKMHDLDRQNDVRYLEQEVVRRDYQYSWLTEI